MIYTHTQYLHYTFALNKYEHKLQMHGSGLGCNRGVYAFMRMMGLIADGNDNDFENRGGLWLNLINLLCSNSFDEVKKKIREIFF